jgi:hypothetical protein
MCTIGTKLRLTPQSTRDSRHTKFQAPAPSWQQDGDEETEPPLAADDGNERLERAFGSFIHRAVGFVCE